MSDGIFDSLSDALISFCISVVELLPESPFLFLEDYGAPLAVNMSYVNWFVDVPSMVNIFTAWLGCVLAWYAYQIVFRWIKVIE